MTMPDMGTGPAADMGGMVEPDSAVVESDGGTPPPGDAGGAPGNDTSGDDDGAQGCSCDVSDESPSPVSLLLLGALAFLRPRRRRH